MQSQENGNRPSPDLAAVKKWLQSDVTVTLRGWHIAAGGALALLLLVGALD
ncbi:MAG: hypothetical protein NXI21_10560 [Alphaproteobacteria bacterium]|nr:hypothetical protein [Alphaproteobacteria bacterium]